MINIKKILRTVWYDGHPPQSKEEIEQERLEAELKQLQEKRIKKERIERAKKFIQARKERIEMERIRVQTAIEYEKNREQRELDAQEKIVDGELEYMDKLDIRCKKCGSDIMDIKGKCSANTCGKYEPTSTTYGRSVME